MIDRHHKLPITRQASLLGLSRSSVYYLPVPVSEADLALMPRIDELHLQMPFAGSRIGFARKPPPSTIFRTPPINTTTNYARLRE